MNCTDVQDFMVAYVAREVSSDISREIWQHIDACADCRSWYEEVQEMADLWEDASPVPNLNLVIPVLARLGSLTPAAPITVASSATPAPLGSELQKWRRTRWNLSNRMVLLHYGVAASITVALFQSGVFENLGSLAKHGVVLSNQVNSLIRLLSSF